MKPDIYEMGKMEAGGKQIALRLVRSRRRKRTISFAIETPTTLRIMAPLRSDIEFIRKMIESRASWIARTIAKLQQRDSRPASREFIDGTGILYLGHAYRLSVTQDNHAPQGCQIYPRRMAVNVHADGMSKENLQQEVRLEIMLWLKRRAKAKIQKRADFWAKKAGIKYQRLIISNPKSRWGSCSARNVIRLNWRLIMAPLSLLDYVVVHELCHVAQKNHKKKFWQFVESIVPDCQSRRKQLRQIGHRLAL